MGGINKESEGSSWDGSTNPTHSTASGSGTGYSTTETGSTVTSELINNRERTPTSTPTKNSEAKEKSRGIRKVYSTADKVDRRENERIRAEARKLQKEGRAAAQRRDFSWQGAADETMALRRIDEQTESSVSESRVDEPRIPGSWAESDICTSSDLGTKVYRHPVHIPVSSAASSAAGPSASELSYAEEKRKKRAGAGYRRTRGGEGASGA